VLARPRCWRTLGYSFSRFPSFSLSVSLAPRHTLSFLFSGTSMSGLLIPAFLTVSTNSAFSSVFSPSCEALRRFCAFSNGSSLAFLLLLPSIFSPPRTVSLRAFHSSDDFPSSSHKEFQTLTFCKYPSVSASPS